MGNTLTIKNRTDMTLGDSIAYMNNALEELGLNIDSIKPNTYYSTDKIKFRAIKDSDSLTIIEMRSLDNLSLEDAKKEINKVHPNIRAYDEKEYYEAFPHDSNAGMNLKGCLVVTDNHELCKTDEDCILMGAYEMEISENDCKFVWWPYPSEPIYGIENFISVLKRQIRSNS
jgi:hypothetical protein